jgi:hypothetical protein
MDTHSHSHNYFVEEFEENYSHNFRIAAESMRNRDKESAHSVEFHNHKVFVDDHIHHMIN